ncbi:MAG: hypothetical protein LC796_08410 [Acidobacteria bacterium]|nr:hypothetical protein [Acidobacteriota bacterium]
MKMFASIPEPLVCCALPAGISRGALGHPGRSAVRSLIKHQECLTDLARSRTF